MAVDTVTITTVLVLLAGLFVREVVGLIVVLVFARLHRRATGAPPKLNELVDALIRVRRLDLSRPDPLATRVLHRINTQGRMRTAAMLAQKASPRPTSPATPTTSTRPSPPSSPSRHRP
jgi:hypothetical protein